MSTAPVLSSPPVMRNVTARRPWIRSMLDLTKARITIATTVVTGAGYAMFAGFETAMWLPMAGVFVLACGSAAMNQVQEWRTDARMERTRNRPIPSGELSPERALLVSVVLIAIGLNILASVERHALIVVGLGVLALVWYNALYVVLKRRTAFAAVPGALVGAIPPVIGWCSAGGVISDPTILEVAFFFFLWQIPHFWLLVQMYGAQYEDAGLPMPTRVMSATQFRRMTSMWILSVAVAGLVLSVTQRLEMPWNVGALVASILLATVTIKRRNDEGRVTAVSLFKAINLYALVILGLVVANACV